MPSAGLSANYVPGGLEDDYYMPPPAPELVSPEPQRHMPQMSNQIQSGLQNMNLDTSASNPNLANEYQQEISRDYANFSNDDDDRNPHLSPFPKLVNPPPNVPPSDDDFEATLDNARMLVLQSNDPEMQLAWASDALVYVGVCADNEERITATKSNAARPATPRIEHQLKTDAMNVVTFLADQHHPKAVFLRGMWLEWGRFGQREDRKEAFRCYSRAADRGYARAEYRIGMLYESYNDPVRALRHYHRGVEAGDSASCYRLGMMTLRGQHGQQQDWKRGVELIKQSADTADENAAQGAYIYGMLLAHQLPLVEVPEEFLPLNETKAKTYLEKAAYLKFAKAQVKMASLYELGAMGCDFSPALSMHYNALASKQGEPEADMALSKWFLCGHEGLFPKNEELSYTYAERAAATGMATAEFAMGYFNEIGMHGPVDLDKSAEWYHKAAKHGNADAEGRLDALAKRQVLSRRDHENVALSRIRSQHGSMRGQRPDRLKQVQPSRLGQVVEDGSQSPISQVPPRGSSITPYPVDDIPTLAPPNARAPSAVPYPVGDGPPDIMAATRPPPTGGFWAGPQPPRASTTVAADQRPSTAFQLAPDHRTANAYSVAPPHGRPYPPTSGPGLAHQPGSANAPQARPGAGQRVFSSPSNFQTYQGGPTAARPPQPGQMPHPKTTPAPRPLQSQVPKIDIGYSAPYEDRRAQPHANANPSYQNKPQSPAVQTSQSVPNFDKPPPPSSRPATSKPPLPAPQQQQQQQQQQQNGGAPRPPPKASAPSSSSQQSSLKPQPLQPRPPGRGPKTFEEMGVHGQQKEQDCVVM